MNIFDEIELESARTVGYINNANKCNSCTKHSFDKEQGVHLCSDYHPQRVCEACEPDTCSAEDITRIKYTDCNDYDPHISPTYLKMMDELGYSPGVPSICQ